MVAAWAEGETEVGDMVKDVMVEEAEGVKERVRKVAEAGVAREGPAMPG